MVANSSGPIERVLGAALIAAPILLFASSLAYFFGGGLNNDRVGGILQVYALAVWGLAIPGLVRFTQPRFPRASAVFLILGVLGAAGGVAFGADSITTAATDVSLRGIPAGWAVLPLGNLFPLAHLGLGIALWRAKAQPGWSGPALIVAAILFPLARFTRIEPLALIADLAFVLTLVPLGWRLLRQRAELTQPGFRNAEVATG